MAIYKQIESGTGTFEKKLITIPSATLSGALLKFTKAQRTDISDRFFGNLFSSFNLPITVGQRQKFTTGEHSTTAFQYLNQDNVIIIEIPKNSYGEMIDGKSVVLNIPTTGGNIQAHSTFFKNAILSTSGHQMYSDPNQQSNEFGQAYNIQELPGQAGLPTPLSGYSSNVAYLFSDSVQKPENNGGFTWASNNKYFKGQTNLPTGTIGSKTAANFSSADGVVDIPVGIVYLDKGFIVLTHPTIVNNFNHAAAMQGGAAYSGTDKFTGVYFTSGATLSYSSFNTEFVQHAVCIAMPNEFYTSTNPTFVEAYGDNIDNNPVAITEVGLYNEKMELIAIAKTNKPLAKNKGSILSFDITIKV